SSFPNGATEMREFLETTGQTSSDVQFKVRAELAAAKIRQMLERREPPITEAQVTAYYNQDKQRFLIPERRELEFTALKSRAAALALRREVAAGKRLGR